MRPNGNSSASGFAVPGHQLPRQVERGFVHVEQERGRPAVRQVGRAGVAEECLPQPAAQLVDRRQRRFRRPAAVTQPAAVERLGRVEKVALGIRLDGDVLLPGDAGAFLMDRHQEGQRLARAGQLPAEAGDRDLKDAGQIFFALAVSAEDHRRLLYRA